jgi:peptide-methionine (S)-S-oxide reductase
MFKTSLTIRILPIFILIAGLFLTDCSKTKEKTVMNDSKKPPKSGKNEPCQPLEKATFAAGCFWHVEQAFADYIGIPGVVSTTVGYTGGTTESPSYKQVCSDATGHAEAVEVTFDPGKISYSQLLEVFWKIHDPTQYNRQGPDVGSQYRSAIFYHNPQQQTLALESKAKLEASHKFSKLIVTQIVPAREFWPAEEYHQKYYQKHAITCYP